MSVFKIKSFLDHKRGIDYWDGADRYAMNLERGRFAVADGVSHSYLPNLWAGILCESFVNSEASSNEDWIGQYAKNQLFMDTQRWGEMSETVLRDATEEAAFLLQLSRDEFQYAGSTLVGIVIEDKSIFYNVLGDSCLFVFDKDSETLVHFSTINEEEGFTNSPDYFLSSGKVVGTWKHGQIPLKEGYVFLATDALSDWLIKEYNQNPAVMDQLWNLNTHDEFMRLVEDARDADVMKDDDVALIMLKIESGEDENYELLYCDTLELLMAKDHDLSKENMREGAIEIEKQEKQEISGGDICDPECEKESQGGEEGIETSQNVVSVSTNTESSDNEEKPACKPIYRDKYCPICGHQYYLEKSLFCGECGHQREMDYDCCDVDYGLIPDFSM